jgi:polyribonucleotide nucleotidyltransferase
MPVLPSESEFAYTMRVVSDILESNGSSSMATVCGGSLAMMDAGIPIRSAVAGVAMGLVKEGDDHVVLSDIAGIEDHEGDMDFKVAGTSEGITALQMDIKIAGVSREVMAQALEQARAGRLHILGKMNEAIAAPRQALSTFAPRLYTINVPKDKIRDIIGPGGKMIRSIVEQTGCKIEVEDDGKVIIASSDEAGANMAIEIIKGLTASAEIGKRYTGTVRRVEAYGAFIEILPGQDGLLHVSEIDHGRVKSVTDYMDLGDTVEVECVDIDSDTGKIRLSRKPLLPPPTEEQIEAEKKARESRESRGGDRGGDRGDRGGRGGDRGPRRGSGGGGRR